jgi:glycosyltransferase involved in cell wall biosynthesis
MRISVVVPTFERPARLSALVAALEGQTLPPSDFEVVVVDDASSDRTPTVLAGLAERSPLSIRTVRMPRNSGPAAARNVGWRTAGADVIAFTDDDCHPGPGWLEAGLAAMDDKGIGVVQGRTLPDPAVKDPGWSKSMLVEEFTGRYESCNMFYRVPVLREAGGFDESITVPFGEDLDLGWKSKRLGVASAFSSDAVVFHDVTFPGVRYWWRYALMHRNFALLARRFPEMRRELFWMRLFIWRNHAVFLTAVAGAVAGIFWRPAFALVLPYAYLLRPRRLARTEFLRIVQQTVFDAAITAGLLLGSIRERTLVL